ncbi:MAG: M28 family peptidase [Candidatus Hodarchaeota archaeon]
MGSDHSLELKLKRTQLCRHCCQTCVILILLALIPATTTSGGDSLPFSLEIPKKRSLADYHHFSTKKPTDTDNFSFSNPFWEKIFNLVDQISYHSFVAHLSGTIGSRPYGSSNNIAAITWIAEMMDELSPSNTTVETWGTHKSVVEIIEGYDENLTDILIIGGNLDTVLRSPGADDNASGIALVLEVLRVLSAYQFPRDLYFVALNAGEPPNAIDGAYEVAKKLYSDKIPVKLMLNADMILHDPTGTGSRLNLYMDNSMALFAAELLKNASRSYGTNIFRLRLGQSFPSDQLAFDNYGFDTICMTEATLSPHHHQYTDTANQPQYNFTMAAEATAAVAATIARLAFHGVSSTTDIDSDGLIDKTEIEIGTDPTNPDTDNDSLLDGEEVHTYLTEPLIADTDLDGLLDGAEIKTWGTDPLQEDTDQDGLTDYEEIEIYHTDPLLADSDNDGISDKRELGVYQTDPRNPDSDADGFEDGEEVAKGWDPLDPSDPENILDETNESHSIPGFIWCVVLGNLLLWSTFRIKRAKRHDQPSGRISN